VQFEEEATLQSVFDVRLRDLLDAGQITDSIYCAAQVSPLVAEGIIMGYLDTCFDLKAHTERQ
jgi:hypothetical protein